MTVGRGFPTTHYTFILLRLIKGPRTAFLSIIWRLLHLVLFYISPFVRMALSVFVFSRMLSKLLDLSVFLELIAHTALFHALA